MTLAGRASGVTSNARMLDLSSPGYGPPLLVIFTYTISYLAQALTSHGPLVRYSKEQEGSWR